MKVMFTLLVKFCLSEKGVGEREEKKNERELSETGKKRLGNN